MVLNRALHNLYSFTGHQPLALSIHTNLYIIIFNGFKEVPCCICHNWFNLLLLVMKLGFSNLIMLEAFLQYIASIVAFLYACVKVLGVMILGQLVCMLYILTHVAKLSSRNGVPVYTPTSS